MLFITTIIPNQNSFQNQAPSLLSSTQPSQILNKISQFYRPNQQTDAAHQLHGSIELTSFLFSEKKEKRKKGTKSELDFSLHHHIRASKQQSPSSTSSTRSYHPPTTDSTIHRRTTKSERWGTNQVTVAAIEIQALDGDDLVEEEVDRPVHSGACPVPHLLEQLVVRRRRRVGPPPAAHPPHRLRRRPPAARCPPPPPNLVVRKMRGRGRGKGSVLEGCEARGLTATGPTGGGVD